MGIYRTLLEEEIAHLDDENNTNIKEVEKTVDDQDANAAEQDRAQDAEFADPGTEDSIDDILNEEYLEIMNEAKNPVPDEFIKFAKDFFKKVDKQIKVIPKSGKSFEDYISSKHKMWYFFDLADPRNNKLKGFLMYSLIGNIGSTISTAVVSKTEYDKLLKIIEKAGIKKKSTKTGAFDFTTSRFAFSKDKKYIFRAYPAMQASGKWFTMYGIGIRCEEYTDKKKRLYSIEGEKLNESTFFDLYK